MARKNVYKVPRNRQTRPINTLRYVTLIVLAVLGIAIWVDGKLNTASAESGSEKTAETSQSRAVKSAVGASELFKVDIPDDVPEIKVDYTGFTVSFNPSWHVPNYVAWELTASEINGEHTRGNASFAVDPNVYGCATLQDYRSSGFDRGHMAPAADMKWSAEAMRDCHYLTNIVPQDHSLNSGRWNSLEMKCRSLAERDGSIIIICGPILSDRITRTIGRGVAVPERFFKVVCAPNANPPRAIAWVIPNRAVRETLGSMAITVDQLEEITGFDFFSAMPEEVEVQMESTMRLRDWELRP